MHGLNYTHVNPLIPPCKLICVAFGFSWSRICSPSHVVVAAIRCHTPEFSVRRKYILELTPVCGEKKKKGKKGSIFRGTVLCNGNAG